MDLVPLPNSFPIAIKLQFPRFCRRRLPIVIVVSKMAETVKEAVTFVEQYSSQAEQYGSGFYGK